MISPVKNGNRMQGHSQIDNRKCLEIRVNGIKVALWKSFLYPF